MDGRLLQPARGCGNSWIVALLSKMDPPFSKQLYTKYTDQFGTKLAGFSVFLEYSLQTSGNSDVDSGPIIKSDSLVWPQTSRSNYFNIHWTRLRLWMVVCSNPFLSVFHLFSSIWFVRCAKFVPSTFLCCSERGLMHTWLLLLCFRAWN